MSLNVLRLLDMVAQAAEDLAQLGDSKYESIVTEMVPTATRLCQAIQQAQRQGRQRHAFELVRGHDKAVFEQLRPLLLDAGLRVSQDEGSPMVVIEWGDPEAITLQVRSPKHGQTAIIRS